MEGEQRKDHTLDPPSLQFFLMFSIWRFREDLPPTQVLSKKSSGRVAEAQKGEASLNARLSIHAVDGGEGNYTWQCRTM